MFFYRALLFKHSLSAAFICSIKLFVFVMRSPGLIRQLHRPRGYERRKTALDIMLCFPFSPQDMEALKRSLAVIESKMAQAKSWLKDPHGQPGNWITFAALVLKR